MTRASSADEAFALFREQVTDIIVSDVQMPRRDGRSLLRQIRSLQEREGGRVPAVALTAMGRAEDRIQSLAAGFNTHVMKPIEPSELVLVVAGLLGRSIPDEARVFG